jgi:glycosyltransferase involved in cell wall biosynthesis
MKASRVLVVSQDVVGERMAGPAIRAFELARALAREFDVTLAAPAPITRAGDGFDIVAWTPSSFPALLTGRDVVVAFGSLIADQPALRKADVAVVADLYDPAGFEALEHHASDDVDTRWRVDLDARRVLLAQLDRADLLLCASERQRDLVIGMLTARGRINPATYDADPTLDGLVAMVPFGVSDTPPTDSGAHPLRRPAGPFGADDVIALWGGGIYDWLDPEVLVDAVAQAGDSVRAYFLAGTHPTPAVPVMASARRAVARARELDVLGTKVVFADEWVPYDERVKLLLDADVGVSLHHRHLETRYAFRTRVLDYLWAGLPIVSSAGDVVADLVDGHDLGAVVPVGDAAALARALDDLCDSERRAACGKRASIVARSFTWDTVSAPLMEFCRRSRRAPDREAAVVRRRRMLETRARIAGFRRRFRPR